MTGQIERYRGAIARRIAVVAWYAVFPSVMFLATGWQHREPGGLWLGGVGTALSLAAFALAAWLPTEALAWDEGGLTHTRGLVTRRFGYADLADLSITPDFHLRPIYHLRSRDGQTLSIEAASLPADPGWTVQLHLMRQWASHLQSTVGQAATAGIDLRAGELAAGTRLTVGIAIVGAVFTSAGILTMARQRPENGIFVPIGLLLLLLAPLAWLLLRPAPPQVRLSSAGLHHGRGLKRLLAWREVTDLRIHASISRSHASERVVIRGPRTRLVISATTPGYLAALALASSNGAPVQLDTLIGAEPLDWATLRNVAAVAGSPDELARMDLRELDCAPADSEAVTERRRSSRRTVVGQLLAFAGMGVGMLAYLTLSDGNDEFTRHEALTELMSAGLPAKATVVSVGPGAGVYYEYEGHQGISGTRGPVGHPWREGDQIDIVVASRHRQYSRPAVERGLAPPPIRSRIDPRPVLRWCVWLGACCLVVGFILVWPERFGKRRLAREA